MRCLDDKSPHDLGAFLLGGGSEVLIKPFQSISPIRFQNK